MNNDLINYDDKKLLHKDIGNGIYLNDYQINLLKSYNIDYQNCKSIEELMYLIESYVDCDEEVESLLDELSEFHYYHDTNK